jgi:hypothetical protein
VRLAFGVAAPIKHNVTQYMITAAVLLAAVTVDAVARRGRTV